MARVVAAAPASRPRPNFVVADERALAVAVNADAPGTAVRREVWLGAPAAAEHGWRAALRRPPFSDLAVRSRASLHSQSASRPLARGILVVLEGAAILSVFSRPPGSC